MHFSFSSDRIRSSGGVATWFRSSRAAGRTRGQWGPDRGACASIVRQIVTKENRRISKSCTAAAAGGRPSRFRFVKIFRSRRCKSRIGPVVFVPRMKVKRYCYLYVYTYTSTRTPPTPRARCTPPEATLKHRCSCVWVFTARAFYFIFFFFFYLKYPSTSLLGFPQVRWTVTGRNTAAPPPSPP